MFGFSYVHITNPYGCSGIGTTVSFLQCNGPGTEKLLNQIIHAV